MDVVPIIFDRPNSCQFCWDAARFTSSQIRSQKMQTCLHDGIGARIYLMKKNEARWFWIPSQTSKVHDRAQSLSYAHTLCMSYVTETFLSSLFHRQM